MKEKTSMDKSLYGIFIFISAIILLMNFSSFVFSPILTFINISISLVLIFIVWIFIKNRENFLFNISCDSSKFVNDNIDSIINGIPLPIVILKDDNFENIVFYNSEFASTFMNHKDKFSFDSLLDLNILKSNLISESDGGNYGFLNIF